MDGVSFEKALARLEEIVRKLEQGELSLEEALQNFSEGVNLVQRCNERLQAAENQVEILRQQLEGGNGEEGEINHELD
ncbi:MAG: exodeoxyribonuclease VII small subunit [Syntrophomonadaceae bacterium]|nr:exodeoxyribonuclease VII small subunit [Syntrophomonadaceae bacterium]